MNQLDRELLNLDPEFAADLGITKSAEEIDAELENPHGFEITHTLNGMSAAEASRLRYVPTGRISEDLAKIEAWRIFHKSRLP